MAAMAAASVLPKLVGERVKRREDPRLIQGGGTYVDDVKIAGMRHLAFKRSDIAHGRVRSIDTSSAAAMNGWRGSSPARTSPSSWPRCRSARPSRRRSTARWRLTRCVSSGTRSRWLWRATATWRATPQTPSWSTTSRCRRWSIPKGDERRGGGRRRRRRGVRGGGRGDRPAHGEPAAGGELHRSARRRGALRAGPRGAGHLVVDPESPHPAHLRGADARPGRGSRAGHRPRGWRRLRGEDQHLRRGVRGGGAVEAGSVCPSSGSRIAPKRSSPPCTAAT